MSVGGASLYVQLGKGVPEMCDPRAPSISSETSCAPAAASPALGGVQRPRICVPDRGLGLGARCPETAEPGRPPGPGRGCRWWEAHRGTKAFSGLTPRRLAGRAARGLSRLPGEGAVGRCSWKGRTAWAGRGPRAGPTAAAGGRGGVFRCSFLGPS